MQPACQRSTPLPGIFVLPWTETEPTSSTKQRMTTRNPPAGFNSRSPCFSPLTDGHLDRRYRHQFGMSYFDGIDVGATTQGVPRLGMQLGDFEPHSLFRHQPPLRISEIVPRPRHICQAISINGIYYPPGIQCTPSHCHGYRVGRNMRGFNGGFFPRFPSTSHLQQVHATSIGNVDGYKFHPFKTLS